MISLPGDTEADWLYAVKAARACINAYCLSDHEFGIGIIEAASLMRQTPPLLHLSVTVMAVGFVELYTT